MRVFLGVVVAAGVWVPGLAGLAASVPECNAKVMQAVTDDMGHTWQPGQTLPVTIARDDAKGGAFCASGGSCVPRKVNGADALQLVNCQVGASIGGGDRRLEPSARLAGSGPAQAMRSRDETERRLSDLGFSNASAGSLADVYVQTPRSSKGRLVGRALAGSAAAMATLKRSDP